MATCNYAQPIPNPPISNAAACAIPIGGSNTTIMDTCCNGHINVIQTYGDGCYQYCTSDFAGSMKACLEQPANLGPYNSGVDGRENWKCFNVVAGKGEGINNEYGNAAGRTRAGIGKLMAVVVGLGVVGMVMGAS